MQPSGPQTSNSHSGSTRQAMSATNDHMRSIPPPLIPLPSPTKHHDPDDPFDSLFSDPSPSKPLFATTKSTERREQGNFPPTPSSANSDFGAFVSVSPSMDPLHQGSGEDLVSFSPLTDAQSSSDFFERFTVEAKERAGKNEQRVLHELLEHEDDPLYWLSPHVPSRDDVSTTAISADPSPPPSLLEIDTSPPDLENHGTATLPLPSSPPNSPPKRQISTPSMASTSTSTSTLPRRWMSNLLSNSVPAPARTTQHDPAASPPQFTKSRRDSVTSLTHSSPFAAHVYVPPSGAPGFAGDRLWNKRGFEFEVEVEERRHIVELTGRREETTPVLTNGIAEKLRSSLPALPRLAKSWSLLYSLDQHGVSLQTFYARCSSRTSSGTVVAMRDSEDRVFGVWMGEKVRLSHGAYYGSGESFLWTSTPHRGHDHVEVFKWTGKNEYVALCESNFISFGGGEGKYGLYLDSNLIDGSSARCPTFDNEVLCASPGHDTNKTVSFECVGLEAWAVVG